MHGMVVTDGMAHREISELGQEGVKVGTKERIVQFCTPIMGVTRVVV